MAGNVHNHAMARSAHFSTDLTEKTIVDIFYTLDVGFDSLLPMTLLVCVCEDGICFFMRPTGASFRSLIDVLVGRNRENVYGMTHMTIVVSVFFYINDLRFSYHCIVIQFIIYALRFG